MSQFCIVIQCIFNACSSTTYGGSGHSGQTASQVGPDFAQDTIIVLGEKFATSSIVSESSALTIDGVATRDLHIREIYMYVIYGMIIINTFLSH